VEGERAELVFAQPQWALTPGQSVVVYESRVCLGGGIIGDGGAAGTDRALSKAIWQRCRAAVSGRISTAAKSAVAMSHWVSQMSPCMARKCSASAP